MEDPENPSDEQMQLRHWQEAFDACRTLLRVREQARTTTTSELLVRRAEGRFWGAAATVLVHCGWLVRGTTFDVGNPANAQAYAELIMFIEHTCELLPEMPTILATDTTTWPTFFRLVRLLQEEADHSTNPADRQDVVGLSWELADMHSSTNATWWAMRATQYSQLEGLPAGLKI